METTLTLNKPEQRCPDFVQHTEVLGLHIPQERNN